MIHRFVRLVHRGAAHQSRCLDQTVDAVDVRFAELTTMRIGGQATVASECAIFNEIPRLAVTTQPPGLQLLQDDG